MAVVEKSKMAVPWSGNTIQTKKQNYILTLNEKVLPFYDKIKEYIINLKSNNYFLCCEHVGQENKHYHIYCQFKTAIKLSIKKLYGSHIEPSFGSPQQNVAYLRCEDEKHKKLGIKSIQIDEIGEIRKSGGRTIKEVKEMKKEDREELPIMYKNIVDKINEEEDNDLDIDDWYKKVKVYYIYGPSGAGKSLEAKNIIKKKSEKYGKKFNELSYVNGFWNGVGNAKICIYDDFRDSDMKASEFIKFIDYNKHHLNIKGGKKLNNYELIIITSIKSPYKIYPNMDDEPRQQWIRRIKIIDKNLILNDPFEFDK